MNITTKNIGDKAEAYALNYLQRQGLTKIKCNYACRFGEVDLVMRDKDTLVFVEVRYRKSQRYGLPEETVNATKQKKIKTTALAFIQVFSQYDQCPLRFDVVAMTDKKDGAGYALKWFEHAFV